MCRRCRVGLAPGPVVRLDSGLVVRAAFRHTGPARNLVHRLKYGPLAEAAGIFAGAMAVMVPAGTEALVPVPRASWRRARYGIDPATALAHETASRAGVPVVPALQAAMWWPRHAIRDAEGRRPPHFRRVASAPSAVVLVDDVLRTGSTLDAALDAMQAPVLVAIVATAPGRVTNRRSVARDAGEAG